MSLKLCTNILYWKMLIRHTTLSDVTVLPICPPPIVWIYGQQLGTNVPCLVHISYYTSVYRQSCFNTIINIVGQQISTELLVSKTRLFLIIQLHRLLLWAEYFLNVQKWVCLAFTTVSESNSQCYRVQPLLAIQYYPNFLNTLSYGSFEHKSDTSDVVKYPVQAMFLYERTITINLPNASNVNTRVYQPYYEPSQCKNTRGKLQ